MKKKRQGTLLIIGMIVLVVIVVPLALFATLPGTFTPPAPESVEGSIPGLPYPEVQAASAGPVAAQGSGPAQETLPEQDAVWEDWLPDERITGDAMVRALLAEFMQRHPELPAESERFHNPNGLPPAFCALALAVLRGEESSAAYYKLLQHPRSLVRQAAIRGLDIAEGSLSTAEGRPAMHRLFSGTEQADLNRLANAAVETLIADTEAGNYSKALSTLQCLGDYAQPAIPHLVWAARNHPEPDMRVFAMNTVYLMDPASNTAGALIAERLADASGNVRLQALQAWAARPLVIGLQNNGYVPPWRLERRPDDAEEVRGVPESVAPAPKSALARAI